jgi:hypothetical protein
LWSKTEHKNLTRHSERETTEETLSTVHSEGGTTEETLNKHLKIPRCALEDVHDLEKQTRFPKK